MRSGTIRLCKVSQMCAFWFYERDGNTWNNILLLFVLVFYCIILFYVFVCLFLLCFYYYFCNWNFRKTHWRRLTLVMSFYYYFSPRYTLHVFLIETTRENAVSVLFPGGMYMKSLYGPCWRSFLHWTLWKLYVFSFTQ